MMSILTKSRTSMIAILIVWMSVFAVSMVLPAHTTYAETGSSIKDRLKSNGSTTQLETTVDKSTNNLVDSARRIFIFGSIVFGIWLAVSFFRAGFSPETLRETKTQLIALVGFLILSFWTEQILGFGFSILGIDINTYLK
ncbi:hypothetical protein ASL14_18985 [Paenibacillus sp. IHB B 3084]|uniref:hypothetical protein n=1 Tax=Paenibacillus sp. IHB B 3084 TaxID=867076 RepID=UPI00072054C6|nr:hypothetical protein [Paenibacillus sp. IHB B 3084]ALP37959.1 hypothetical protein ASL14_18985 [Paenibacillus sp. IHB B 3084]